MDHTNHVRLVEAELTPDILENATVYGLDDEDIGSVSHVHGAGGTAQVVIDVGVSSASARNRWPFPRGSWISCGTKMAKFTP